MSHDITQNGLVSAEKKVSLYADNNITMQDTVLHAKSQDVLHTTAGIGRLWPEIQGTRSPLQQDHNDQEP